MHTALASLVSALALAGALRQENASDFARRRELAEALFARGAFTRAHEAYLDARRLARESADARWCDFRIADTSWRARAASETPDATIFDAAERDLRALVRDVDRADEEDRVWAEVCESLGDLFWTRRDLGDWGRAWPEYERALAWWARSSELDLARARYLAIVWKTASQHGVEAWERGHWIPTPDAVLENALAIATEPRDIARAHFLRAVTLESRGGDWRAIQRVEREYRAALEGGPKEPWYDDALFGLAEWLNFRGRAVRVEGGAWRQEPDHVGALALYRRLAEELGAGESRYHDDAKNRAAEIVRPDLDLTVGHAFLPGSPVAFDLAWRNVRRVELSLHAVDLARDVAFGRDHAAGAYVDALGAPRGEVVARWSHDTRDTGEHRRATAQVVAPRDLAPGAYLLIASGAGVARRDLVLVGDTCVVLRASPTRALAWVTSATLGEPVAGAEIALWERFHDGARWVWQRHAAKCGDGGLAVVELERRASHRELFAAALAGEREAFALANVGARSISQGWRIQASTDRSAYRPEDTVRYKLVARQFVDQRYTTPAGAKLRYKVQDPRGTEAAAGEVELNAFGSAWGELALAPSYALGEYQIVFETASGEWLGSAPFFRLEEYVLPEFEVEVRVPEAGGKRRLVRAGDRVEVEIAARYYSGGPVANATVQALVHQRPFWLSRPVPREFPWLFDSERGFDPRWWGGGQLVQQSTLTTGPDGVARLAFDTPLDAASDLEFTIEARAIDAARREVVADGRVRVARQSYAVFPHARHNVYRPGDTVEVDFELVDANEQPVEADGVATVYRERWFGVWRGPQGEELSDEERAALARDVAQRCALVRHGYVREAILTRPLRSDAGGRATLSFRADRAGCYQVAWSSRDADGAPIEAATAVWVADEDTRDLGWRRGELEILVDRDTLRAGEEAVVMLSSSFGGGAVLVCVGGEDFVSWQVVEMRGPAKLLRIPLDERSVPNVFVSAELVRAGEVWSDVEELVVPPLEHFLEVALEPVSPAVEPGAEGEWLVRTLRRDGEPVEAEVALAVADESVLAIQAEYGVDPRRFFFGEKRGFGLAGASTSELRRFARLVERGDGRLVDERELAAQRDVEADRWQDGLAIEEKLGALTAGPEGRNARGARLRKDEGAKLSDSLAAPAARQEAGMGGGGPAVTVRTDFSATALWRPDVVTGADGTARVKLRYPQSLTAWRATARAATRGSAFGFASGRVRADLPLTIRLEAPRFLVEGDLATISGLVDNHTERDVEVAAALVRLVADDAGEREVELGGGPRTLSVPRMGQVRVDWLVRATDVGPLRLRASARSAERGDAVERTIPVHEHGLEQLAAASGVVRGERGVLSIDLPSEREPGTTRVRVLASPSLAATMLDALPYLIDYPYGCVEQTMSRFLPAVAVAKTLRDARLDPELAFAGVFGGVEGEYASRTHPKGAKPRALLGEVTSKSLQRIYDFQHEDGGWGWWKEDASDLFMSAYVVWGLELARRAEIDVRVDALDRGAAFLSRNMVEAETQPDLRAWMLHALAARTHGARREPDRDARRAMDELFAERTRLNAYGRALLALAADDMGDRARALQLVEALADGATIDRTPDASAVQRGGGSGQALAQATAHWGADRIGRRWSDGPVETTAAVLRALVAIAPDHELTAPAMVWLVKNRRGAQWSSTRDTALAVLALDEYLVASGEIDAEGEYEILVNGARVATERIARGGALTARREIAIDERALRPGANEIRIERRSGSGPLYVAVEARYFNREERVRSAGNELFVRREYFALVPRKTLLAGVVYERVALSEGSRVASGTRIETVLTIEAKNELEYVVLEDLKPAGIESVEARSGGSLAARELRADAIAARMAGRTPPRAGADATGRTRPVYRELRDRKVALFLSALPQGTWEIVYEMRAEVPGEFRALPLVGQAMYAPEIRGNDLEIALTVD